MTNLIIFWPPPSNDMITDHTLCDMIDDHHDSNPTSGLSQKPRPTQKSRADANVLVQTRCLKGYNVRHYPDPIPKVRTLIGPQ